MATLSALRLRVLFLSFITLLCCHACFAQWQKVKSVKVDPVQFTAVDRPGELYLVSTNGMIKKYSVTGQLLATSPVLSPTLFDPQDGARIFAYHASPPSYVMLTPALEERTSPIKLDSAFAIYPVLAAPSGDHNLIILDSGDWSLKRIDTKTSSILLDVVIKDHLPAKPIIKYMREYQHFIFVQTENEVSIFNNMGRFLRSLPINKPFNFLGEELYYAEGGSLKFFDLFTTETREILLPSTCDFAILTDERLFLIKSQSLEIFDLKR